MPLLSSNILFQSVLILMSLTLSVATANFNGSYSSTKMHLLKDFIVKNDIDIIFLQEIRHTDFSIIYNYNAYVNVGTESLGTAILTKIGIKLEDIEKLPSGRGIKGTYNKYVFMNIYAPSGSNKRSERNLFFQNDIAYFLRDLPAHCILGGDFNCVLRREDCTSDFRPSNTLQQHTNSLQLTDAWTTKHKTPGYTFFTGKSASRLDRFYVTRALTPCLQRMEVLPTPFSDHAAVNMKIKLDVKFLTMGRSYWKMNISCLQNTDVIENFKTEWQLWQKRKK